MKFKEYGLNYLDAIRPSAKPNTGKAYLSAFRNHLKPWFGRMEVGDIEYRDVKAFVLQSRARLSPASLRLILAPLRMILDEAVKEGLLLSNPCMGLGRLIKQANESATVDPFTVEEIKHLEMESSEMAVEFLYKTGMRFGELCALEWDCVDLRNCTVTVKRNRPANCKETGTPKTKRSNRVVDLSPDLASKVSWLGAVASNADPQPKLVFGNLSYSHFHKYFKRIQEVLGIRYRPPHQLRHSFASHLLSKGAPLVYVAAQLGDNPTTVLSTYAHWIPVGNTVGVEVLD